MRLRSTKAYAGVAGLTVALAATAIVIGTASAHPVSHHKSSSTVTRSVSHHRTAHETSTSEATIESLALTAASNNGDADPTSIKHAIGTFTSAVGVVLPGAAPQTPDSSSTIAITETGNFTDTSAPTPYIPGKGLAPAPTGTVMTVLFNATTDQPCGVAISKTAPDLSTVGAVTTDSTSQAQTDVIRSRLTRK